MFVFVCVFVFILVFVFACVFTMKTMVKFADDDKSFFARSLPRLRSHHRLPCSSSNDDHNPDDDDDNDLDDPNDDVCQLSILMRRRSFFLTIGFPAQVIMMIQITLLKRLQNGLVE